MIRQQLTHDKVFMAIARGVAEDSPDIRTKVGCVITQDNVMICSGYNSIAGDISMRDSNGDSVPEVLHAETNTLGTMLKYGIASLGATMYVTREPCFHCAKLIYQAGIKRVVFKDYHSCPLGRYYLFDRDILVERI